MKDAGTKRFVSAVILAAGEARRMGKPKQLLDWGEGTILQAVIDNAQASQLDEVIVVLGHSGESIREALALPYSGPLRAVMAPDWQLGQGRSLRAGLSAVDARASAAAVLLADQPGVDAALIDRVLAALPGCGKTIHRPIHRPINPDASSRAVPGHPVVLSASVFAPASALRGTEGVRALLREHPDWLCSVEAPGEAPADVDTPEDYERQRPRAH